MCHSHLQASHSHLHVQDFLSPLQVFPSGSSNTKLYDRLNLLDTVYSVSM